MVVMPLISGGALAAVGKQFGVRVPDFLAGRSGGGGGGFGGMGDLAKEMGGGYYGSHGYGGREGGGGGGDAFGSLLNIAKAFV
jgi:hypothetical protein